MRFGPERIMTNTMTCAMKHEAWTWYLPSQLVPEKTLCSRWELCTYRHYYLLVIVFSFDDRHLPMTMNIKLWYSHLIILSSTVVYIVGCSRKKIVISPILIDIFVFNVHTSFFWLESTASCSLHNSTASFDLIFWWAYEERVG